MVTRVLAFYLTLSDTTQEWVGVKVQDPHIVLLILSRDGGLLPPARDESCGFPHSLFFDTTWGEAPFFSSGRLEIKVPHLAFAVRGRMVFCWSRTDTVFLFYEVALFCFGMLLFWGIFLSSLLGFSVLLALPATSLVYMKQKENPGNAPPCHSLGHKTCLLLFTF